MSKHAFLSPSGSHRWLNCTPSAMLESEFPGGSSSAAEEGTAAHEFCEHKLKKALRRRSKRPVSDYDSDEMQEYTDSYVDYVLEQLEVAKQTCKDPMVLIEQKVDFSEYVPDGYGTADCIIVSDNTLQIIDFKYGLLPYRTDTIRRGDIHPHRLRPSVPSASARSLPMLSVHLPG